MRVLSDIVKRRSFRANVKRREPSNVPRAPNDLCGFGHRSAGVTHVMSAKLDRLAVGSILKQERSFLSVFDRCGRDACIGHRALQILLPEFAENVGSERAMDGH